jgi:hypothetical protein
MIPNTAPAAAAVEMPTANPMAETRSAFTPRSFADVGFWTIARTDLPNLVRHNSRYRPARMTADSRNANTRTSGTWYPATSHDLCA